MARGGKLKFKRGGGRSFSRHLTLDKNGTAVAVERSKEGDDDEEDDDDDDDEEEDEEEEEEEEEESTTGAAPEMGRAERRELKKQGKVKKDAEEESENEEDALLANPNRTIGSMKIADLSAPRELSRREREAKDKADAQDRYWKLHAQGKTEQAKSDLARLKKIRAEREAAQAKRKAEQDARAAEMEVKKAK